MLIEEIKRLAEAVYTDVLRNRRYFHAYPELSYEEYETSAFIKSRLEEMRISWEAMAGTGIVALIHGEKSSDQVIALRSDIDALPVMEANKLEYSSRNVGVMHACGHDAHTASLLGTASILQSVRSEFGGIVKLIFQPGEEKLPGGASLMIAEGVLENPRPAAVLGQHVIPSIGTGQIGMRKGRHMASMDELYIAVHGKGGHGGMPHQNIDPVLIASHIIVALQQVVSRLTDPTVPAVLSIGKVMANGSTNVIPDEVLMEGTFRTIDEKWRMEAHIRMKKIACGIAESMGGHCEFRIARGYPVLINEEKLTEQVRGFAAEYLGEENVVDTDIWMASEDFAYYSQLADSCFYLLGTGNKEKGIVSSLHSPTFTIDEDALAISTGLMAYIAIRRLGN